MILTTTTKLVIGTAIVVVLVALVARSFLPPSPVYHQNAGAFLLRGVNVITFTGKEGKKIVHRAIDVGVANDQLHLCHDGESGSCHVDLSDRQEMEIIEDYKGMFVTPGFIDVHTHLPPANVLQLTPYFSLLFLYHGVTSVRDAGDADGTAVEAALSAISTGAYPVPRLRACGSFISGPNPRWINSIVLDPTSNPTQLYAAAAAAVDQVKSQSPGTSHQDLVAR